MLSSSDSDSLPEVGDVLASQKSPASCKTIKRKTRPASGRSSDPASSRPRKKRKVQNPKVNGEARAASPIELTSEDEPPPRKVKPNSRFLTAKKSGRPKLLQGEVIDLCSDSEAKVRPPGPGKKSQPRPPPQEDIIELLSTDNEDQRISSRIPPSKGVHTPAQAARPSGGPSIEIAQEKEGSGEDVQMDINDISQNTIRPPSLDRLGRPSNSMFPVPTQGPQRPPSPDYIAPSRLRRPSDSMSPVPFEELQQHPSPKEFDINHLPEPEERPSSPDRVHNETEPIRSPEPEDPPEPLQSIYNDAFRRTPGPEDTPARRSAFSCRSQPRPHPTIEIHTFETFDLDVSPPPLLTASFFTRARQALPTPKVPLHSNSKSTTPPPAQSHSHPASIKPSSGGSTSRSGSLAARAESRVPSLPPQLWTESTPEANAAEDHSNNEGEPPVENVTSGAAPSRVETGLRPSSPQLRLSQHEIMVETPHEGGLADDAQDIISGPLSSEEVPDNHRPSTAAIPRTGDKMVFDEALTHSVPTQSTSIERMIPKAALPQVDTTTTRSPPAQPVTNQPEPMAVNEVPNSAVPSSSTLTGEITAPELRSPSDLELSPAAQLLMNQPEARYESDSMVVEEVPVVISQFELASKVEIPTEQSTPGQVVTPIPSVSPPSPGSLAAPITVKGGNEPPPPNPPLRSSPESTPEEIAPNPPVQQAAEKPSVESYKSPMAVAHTPESAPCTLPTSVAKDNDGNTTATQSWHDPEPDSATDIQEIADMLLFGGENSTRARTDSVELTDEELLTIGLCYPDD